MHEHVSPYRMDDAAARAACAAHGATTERSRAALMGVSVSTMRRLRDGNVPPRLDTVTRVSTRLGIHRDTLFPGLAGTPSKKTQHEAISEAAAKVVAGWPKLSEEQRLEVKRVIDAVTVTPAAAPRQTARRAA